MTSYTLYLGAPAKEFHIISKTTIKDDCRINKRMQMGGSLSSDQSEGFVRYCQLVKPLLHFQDKEDASVINAF